jgi:hypothetical protein
MTAKEDLVEPNMPYGQQPTMDTTDQQQPPPDYQSSLKVENEIEEIEEEISKKQRDLFK